MRFIYETWFRVELSYSQHKKGSFTKRVGYFGVIQSKYIPFGLTGLRVFLKPLDTANCKLEPLKGFREKPAESGLADGFPFQQKLQNG